jgi:hypothetical protein
LRHNAAAIFSLPTRKLWQAIEESTDDPHIFTVLLSFICGRQALHPIFSGHFERIFEMFLFAGTDWIQTRRHALRKVIDFAIGHIDVMAYQHLLFRLCGDFERILRDEVCYPISEIVCNILKSAARQCSIFGFPDHPPQDPCANQQRRMNNYLARCPFLCVTGSPLCITRDKPVPSPGWLSTAKDPTIAFAARTDDARRKANYEKRFHPFGPVRGESDKRFAELRVYLLISSIWNIATQNLNVWAILQDPEHNYINIQYLLMCGIYSPPRSIIANIAFKVLKVLYWGSDHTQFDVPSLVGNSDFERILDEYAADFEFSPHPTPQMRAAFPLFWNQRYREFRSVDRPDTVEVKLMSDRDAERPSVRYTLTFPGMSPLELYTRFLLDDPPLSDSFSFDIFSVIEQHVQRTNPYRKLPDHIDREEYLARQKTVVDRDAPIFNMLRTKFMADMQMFDMKALLRFIATDVNCPTNEEVAKHIDSRWRQATNGWAAHLAVSLIDGEVFQFDDSMCGNMPEIASWPDDSVCQVILHRGVGQRISIASRDDWLRTSVKSMSLFIMIEPPL